MNDGNIDSSFECTKLVFAGLIQLLSLEPLNNATSVFNYALFFCCCFLAMRHAGSYFPDQGSNLCPLQWKSGVLTTGPPGKSSTSIFRAAVAAQ